MLTRKATDRMTAIMQNSVERSIETHAGECIAVDDLTGTEYGHKWRNGEAHIYIEHRPNLRSIELEGVSYVYAVKVELVAVIPD